MTMPLRILMTADAVGGVWVYATELACALCRAGNAVMLAVIGPRPRPDQLRPLRSVPGLQLKITDRLLEWMDPAGTDIRRAGQMLRSIADAFQPDVVHLNSFREGNLNWSAPVLIVAHSCVRTWWRACRSGPLGGARWSTYCDRVAAGLSAADAWVAPSAAFHGLIAATYRPPAQGRVIRNGLTIAARATAKQPYILAAGRLWDEAKNLAAVAAIASELPWPVRVAGGMCGPDGGDAKAAHGEVESLGALPRPALLDEMRNASIFVSPALYEPFGLTVLEAAAAGCALVLSDLPSFRELWDDAALFVSPRDRSALRTALQSLCRDEALRARLQATARMRSRRYSQRAMVGAYLRLYREMTASPPPYPPPFPHPSLPRLRGRVREGAGEGREGARAGAALGFAV
jgi:glycosyltransferase involved in cell wall biosynthesis